MPTPSEPLSYPRELFARWALIVLSLLVPALVVMRYALPVSEPLSSGALGPGAPAAPDPAYVQVLVVTVSTWPATTAEDLPELRAFRRRSGRANRAYANATSHAASAASLWTGRWTRSHGVLDASQRLPRGAWTLADSARRGGYATAAFLEEPFVSVTDIQGFEEVHERTELDPLQLASDAADFLRRNRGHRTLTWVHFHDPGPELEALERLLGAVRTELEAAGDTGEFLGILTAFERELPQPAAAADAAGASRLAQRVPDAFRVPLVVRFPGDANADRPGNGLLALSDLTGMLRSVLRTPPPDPLSAQAPLQSRGDYAQEILRGSRGSLWTWLYAGEELLFIEDEAVVHAPLRGGVPDADSLRFDWTELPDGGGEPRGVYRDLADRFAQALGTPEAPPVAPPAEVPRPWRGLRGW